jgi:hypothetical protein
MDKDRIIQQGDTAKFQVIIKHEDFDQQTDSFCVEIHGGIPDTPVTIDREDMLHNEDGNFFMLVPTAGLVGPLKAYCHYYVTDSDMGSGQREEIDIQMLAFVTDEPCPHVPCCGQCAEDDAHVTYKRVWRNDAHTLYLNLRTADKQPVVDADGKRIRVRKEEKDIY